MELQEEKTIVEILKELLDARQYTMLRQTIDAIFNPDLPFMPTADRDRCRHCPYAELCRK